MPELEQEQVIREAAYRKWEEAGRPEGDGLCFWLDSEREYLHQCCPSEATEQGDDFILQAVSESCSTAGGEQASCQDLETSSAPNCTESNSRTTRRSRRRVT